MNVGSGQRSVVDTREVGLVLQSDEWCKETTVSEMGNGQEEMWKLD